MLQRSRRLLRGNIASLNEDLSSGLRINRPSEDPVGFEQARRLERFNKEIDQYERSIDAAQNWSNVTQSSLDQLAELYTDAYEDTVQAANDTYSDDERSAIAERLRGIKSSVIDELNTKVDDEYIFAGNNSLQKPFIEDPASPDYGQVIDPGSGPPPVAAPDYTQFDGDRVRHIGPRLQVKINQTAQDVHQITAEPVGPPDDPVDPPAGITIIDALDNLIQAVDPTTADPAPLTNNPPFPAPGPADQQEAIQNGLHVIGIARDHLIDRGAKAGEVGNRLNLAERRLEDVALSVTERQSETEDTNFASAISDLQRNQTSLQAALRVQSTADQISLLDYI
jgi:flagellar hook-associated protein 3 FlgL